MRTAPDKINGFYPFNVPTPRARMRTAPYLVDADNSLRAPTPRARMRTAPVSSCLMFSPPTPTPRARMRTAPRACLLSPSRIQRQPLYRRSPLWGGPIYLWPFARSWGILAHVMTEIQEIMHRVIKVCKNSQRAVLIATAPAPVPYPYPYPYFYAQPS